MRLSARIPDRKRDATIAKRVLIWSLIIWTALLLSVLALVFVANFGS